ncbi:Uncharacterized protein Rs2_37000 [Raphanus sativus]|nr:Uncharacterized protein Rs2_37000 [Raphanus sativus]
MNAKTREFLLSRTCWNVAGFPMFVVPWSPDFTPYEAPITQAVVPVELRNVPYLLFNKESLSRLATAVGKHVSLYRKQSAKKSSKSQSFTLEWTLPSHYRGRSYLGSPTDKCKSHAAKEASRRRSVSPARNKHRSRTRQGHQRTPSNSLAPPKSLSPPASECEIEVEEVEIVKDTHTRESPEEASNSPTSVKEMGACVSDDVVIKEKEDVNSCIDTSQNNALLDLQSDNPGNQQLKREVNRSGQLRLAPENPYFLVTRGKSGRRVNIPI